MPKRSDAEPYNERLAATIVAAVTGCGTKRLDAGGVQRPDYALLDAAGEQIGVLEVTAFTDEDQNKFLADRELHHRLWPEPRLRWHWSVRLDGHNRMLKPLREPLSIALPELEARGVLRVSVHPENYRVAAARMPPELVDLGVVEAEVVRIADPDVAMVRISVTTVDVSASIDDARRAVEDVSIGTTTSGSSAAAGSAGSCSCGSTRSPEQDQR